MIQLFSADTVGLIWGALGFLTLSFALSRALRGARHGFSIRLQLFFVLFTASMLTTSLIGFWALDRIEARALQILEQRGLSALVIEEFFRDFGAKTGLILGLLALISAASAWALGRAIASPIEQLADAAEGVSDGAYLSSLPHPSGREVRRLRQSLMQMGEALEDRRQFERFIADLSHDLKNPVAAIQASLEVLQSGAHHDPDARLHFIARASEACTRLNRLLSDFLGIARLEARGIRFDPHPFSPLTPLHAASRSMSEVAALKNVQLILLGDELDLEIKGSQRWLTRAFENLLSNSIRYCPTEGKVWIEWAFEREGVTLLFSDEGTGVPEHLANEIFARFVSVPKQGHGATSEGTGLGLAIVKRTIEAHGGQVDLLGRDTQVQQTKIKRTVSGAQFLIWLPMHTLSISPEEQVTKSTQSAGLSS